MPELIPIGSRVYIGDPDDLEDVTADDVVSARVEAICIYRNFTQYIVTRWVEGVKHVETVEAGEIKFDEYYDDPHSEPIKVFVGDF